MNDNGKLAVSCVILTLNEETNLPTVLASLARGDQVVVVDSGSSDQTVPMSRGLGAEVLENAWPGLRGATELGACSVQVAAPA